MSAAPVTGRGPSCTLPGPSGEVPRRGGGDGGFAELLAGQARAGAAPDDR
ncbi:hypothetical protein HLB09_17415, partial [Pseudokineococcus marinus]|nr:hypothetical protein [Pseudokineococcus marinus]